MSRKCLRCVIFFLPPSFFLRQLYELCWLGLQSQVWFRAHPNRPEKAKRSVGEWNRDKFQIVKDSMNKILSSSGNTNGARIAKKQAAFSGCYQLRRPDGITTHIPKNGSINLTFANKSLNGFYLVASCSLFQRILLLNKHYFVFFIKCFSCGFFMILYDKILGFSLSTCIVLLNIFFWICCHF